MEEIYKTEQNNGVKTYITKYFICTKEEYEKIKTKYNKKEKEEKALPYFNNNTWQGEYFEFIGFNITWGNEFMDLIEYYIKPNTINNIKKEEEKEYMWTYNS